MASPWRAPPARGQLCKGAVKFGSDQNFAGPAFDAETSVASLPRGRTWEARLALLEAASPAFLTGKQVERLIGHLTW